MHAKFVFVDDVASISWIYALFACFIALIEIGRYSHKYFLTIVDDHSRFLWIILLKSKAEAANHVKSFITMIENQFQVTPKFIRSDNGPEFMLSEFYASLGILNQKSCVETAQ